MALLNVTQADFFDTLGQEGIVLIDWWADWCEPCSEFETIYDEVATQHPDIVFAKVDADSQPELANALSVRAVPTVMIARDGILLYAQSGLLDAEALEDLIVQAQGLDMDEVRRKVAEALSYGVA